VDTGDLSTWEGRMAAAAAARRAAAERKREEAEEARRQEVIAAGFDPDMPEGHEAHHWHARGNGYECSCGQLHGGIWSFVPDARWGSDDPAEVAQVRREETDWLAWISCYICGAPGVTAQDVTWPPRRMERQSVT